MTGDHPESQYDLGKMHASGQGVALSVATAALWYTRSAELGNGDAQLALSECYYHGQGLAQDERLSMIWLGESARQGVPAASWRLYQKHLHGEGVEASAEEAELWLKNAAEQGSAEAQDVYDRRQGDRLPKVTEIDDEGSSGENNAAGSSAVPEPAADWAPEAAGTDWKAQVASAFKTMPNSRASAPSPATVGNNADKSNGSSSGKAGSGDDGSGGASASAATTEPRPAASSRRLATSNPGALLPGTKVEVVGLTGNVALNGRVGVVKPRQRNTNPDRVPVLLDGEKKSKAIRVGNLRILYVVAGGAMPLD